MPDTQCLYAGCADVAAGERVGCPDSSSRPLPFRHTAARAWSHTLNHTTGLLAVFFHHFSWLHASLLLSVEKKTCLARFSTVLHIAWMILYDFSLFMSPFVGFSYIQSCAMYVVNDWSVDDDLMSTTNKRNPIIASIGFV